MNEIIKFEHEEFGTVRTTIIDGEPWFVGQDICKALGDTNYSRSLSNVDDEDKKRLPIVDSLGETWNITYNVIYVNVCGLYSLLFTMQSQQSQKANKSNEDDNEDDRLQDMYPFKIIKAAETQIKIEKLKRFKRWIGHDVIPSIRKTGSYIFNNNTDKNTITNEDISELVSTVNKVLEQNAILLSMLNNKENKVNNNNEFNNHAKQARTVNISC